MPRKLAISLLFVLCTGPASAQLLGCLIEPSETAELGSPVVGVIAELLVERGDTVRQGQTVARLMAGVERATYSAAETRSQADAELRSAQSAEEFARAKLERTENLFKENFVSSIVRDQAATEYELARAKTRQAHEQTRVSAQELAVAGAQLGQRSIRSPISGVVVERYLSRGERVEEKPLFRIATIDPLRVEVLVPAAAFNKIAIGSNAVVTPGIAGFGNHEAKVVLVDRVIDAASNTFRVRLSLPNPGGTMPAGMRCKAAFPGLEAPPAVVPAAAPASAPARPANRSGAAGGEGLAVSVLPSRR